MQSVLLKQTKLDYRSREAFKTLRTNVDFAGEELQVVCITSATPNEGKSSIAFELARSFAENGRRTILVDADLRKSVLRTRGKSGRIRYGLTNILAGQCGIEEAITETDVEDFHMIFAGPVPPNPSELLSGKRFEKMIESLKADYDMILIDTSPIGSVIDAAVVARRCDGIILVLKAGAVSYRYARKVKAQLETSETPLLGVVLNQVNLSGKGIYGKYYGRYYGKYYGNYYGNYGADEE